MEYYSKFIEWFKTRCFYKSFALDTKFIYVILYDLLFYAILAGSITMYWFFVLPKIEMMKQSNLLLQNMKNMTQLELQSNFMPIQDAFFGFQFYTIALILLAVMSYCFFKHLIWDIIMRKKMSVKSFFKFIALNLMLALCAVIIIVLGYLILKQEIFTIVISVVLTPLLVYFMFILHPVFITEKKLFKSIEKAFKISTAKIHKFLLPYALILLIGFVLLQIIGFLKVLPTQIYALIVVLLIVVYFTWIKFYIAEIVKKFY